MSSSVQVSSSSTSNFQPIFEKAVEEYKKKTGKDLTTHPLAIQIKGCDSPEAILTVLEGKANELNRSRSSDERLTKWLNPTVNILNALSATLGQGAGLVFPPTTIIFSGIGILLVAAKSTAANRDVLVKLFGKMESFFERLKVYTNVPLSPALTEELAKIMAEVLLILAIATKGIKEGRTKLFFKKVAGMNDLEDALQRFGELEQRELLTGIAQVASDTAVLKDDAKETKANAKETKADAKEIKADTNETKADAKEIKADAKAITVMVKDIVNKMGTHSWEEVLQKLKPWLSPPDPSTNYTIGLRNHSEETANWFFEGRTFREWHSAGSLLWIHGKPGSGKTILCSTVIQHIISSSKGGRASVAYFYFDFQDENKKHRHNLLPSLLVQFAARSVSCRDIVSRFYSAHEDGKEQPSDEDLKSCLIDMLSVSPEHPMYIIMDALDECPDSSGVRSPRGHVLRFIQELVELRLRNLHICVTSRPEIDIYNRLEPLTSLRISLHDQTGHREDIAKFIRSEVDVIASDKRWRDDDKKLVIETLSEKADGMFRWVFCQLEMLRLCLRSRVRHFLHELPDSLDETYERILKGIHKTNRVYVQQLLQCLAVAIRPLRVEELAKVLKIDAEAIEGVVTTVDADLREEQEHELLSACPSLIAIAGSDGSRVVQFSHFSVKEFLTSDRLSTSCEDIVCYHIIPEAAHTTLARASLGILLRLDDSVLSSKAMSIPLALYAAEYWVSHAQFGSVSSRVIGQMKALFDSDRPYFPAWLRICDIDGTPPEGTTPKPLYYSALCGFCDLVEHLLKKQSEDINAIGGKHDYPLIAALHGEYIQVAELLFQHGANLEVQGKDKQTPLHRALGWPNNSAVVALQFLLKHGANVTARRKDLWTPLHLVASRGDFEIAQLLDYGAEGSSRDKKGAAPVHGLLSGGSEIARVLLDLGANANAKDNWGWTPLHRVLGAGGYSDEQRFGMAQLLVERGADVDAQDQCHGTPLHMVPYFLQLKLVRMLVDHGANVNAKNNRCQTPLHRVLKTEDYSDEDRFSVAQLLLEHGANVNARDVCGETPLHLAPHFLDLKLVRMLVDLAADVNAEDNQGQTPLHRVLETHNQPDKDRLSIVQLLVECGSSLDVNTRYEEYETLLHLASYQLELKLVRTLLDRGANVNAKDNQGQTPLHRVLQVQGHAGEDHFEIAQLLVERGAAVNARDEDDNTPLHLASYQLELIFVRMLVNNGANVNAEDNQGRTPLYRVSEDKGFSGEDRFGIARLLLERGADPNTRPEGQKTLLHLASFQLELKFVRILVDYGANVNAEDNEGGTPLRRVLGARGLSDKDSFDIAQILIERGADVNARYKNRETLLHLASFQRELKFVRMLVDHGANVNAEDNQGWTPLLRLLGAGGFSDKDSFGIAQLLMERGADVNARCEDRKTPLHLASYQLELKLVLMLVDHGANVNAEDNEGWTPLYRVLEVHGDRDGDRFGIAQLLVERGADVNARDKCLGTPLHLASYHGELKLVRMLVDYGANINAKDNEGRIPLHRVSEAKGLSGEDCPGIQVAQLLIERGADVNTRHNNRGTPLHSASYQGELELVRMLVDYGANVNAKDNEGRTPLHRVSEAKGLSGEDHFSIAQLLVTHGADVDTRDKNRETLLHSASCQGKLQLVRVLVDRGANTNAKGNWDQTPLHQVLAAEDCPSEDRFSVAQLLIEHGADVNARNVCGETPLHMAPRFWDLNLVRMLIDRGANVNAEDKQGQTPLHRVLEAKGFADEDRFGIAQLLVERGADVNARHENYDTPLHLASSSLELSLVRILLDHGANANAEDSRGRTPLHRVSEGSHHSHEDRFNVARLLVEGGANANILDKDHETPLHVASRLASLEVVWVLLKHDGDLSVENKEGKIPFQLAQENMSKDMKRSRPENSLWRAQRTKWIVLMGLLYGY